MDETPRRTADKSRSVPDSGGSFSVLPVPDDEEVLWAGRKSLSGAAINGMVAAIPPLLMFASCFVLLTSMQSPLSFLSRAILVLVLLLVPFSAFSVGYRARQFSYTATDCAVYTGVGLVLDSDATPDTERIPYSEIIRIKRRETALSRLFGIGSLTLVTEFDASNDESSDQSLIDLYLDTANVHLTGVENPDEVERFLSDRVELTGSNP